MLRKFRIMSLLPLVAVALLVACAPERDADAPPLRTPGEFEPQAAVWLAWPAYDYADEWPMADLTAEIVRALEPHTPVRMLVRDAEWQSVAEQALAERGVPVHHVTYISIPYDEPWLRDMGPVFVLTGDGRKQNVDFNFNAWGVYPDSDEYCRIEERVDRLIAQHLGIANSMTRLIGEGGNREFNGRGVMMVVEPTERQRNPNMTRDEIAEEFERLFGVRKIIWLPHHLYDDSLATTVYPGPDGERAFGFGVGHVDEVARFADARTILLAEVDEDEVEGDPIAAENRRRLDENYQVLLQATDQDGNPFRIVRIPAAMTEYVRLTEDDYSHVLSSDFTFDDGTTGHDGSIWWLPTKSYVNFLITNGAVLAARYWRPGRPDLEREKDEEAVRVLQSVFPDREIITFDPVQILAVNTGGGGIHCITAQEPALPAP